MEMLIGMSTVLLDAATTVPTGSVPEVVEAVNSGSAIAIAAAAIMLVTNLFKARRLGGLVKRVPKRWRVAIPIVLGGVAGVLSSVVAGMPWKDAAMVGLFSGPTAVFAHEAVIEAILGKARSREPGK